MPCRTFGIIGQDFLSKYDCILNFEHNTLSIDSNQTLVIPLQMGKLGYNNYISLPARLESIHFITTPIQHDSVVIPKQLSEGIFLAGA